MGFQRCRHLAVALLVFGCGARTGPDELDPDEVLDARVPECLRDEHCDDGLDCTDERCVRRSCVVSPISARCDDGLFCTGPGRCDRGLGCVYEDDPCVDDVACTEDLCDEATDTCTFAPRRGRCPLSSRCDPERGCVAGAIVNDPDGLWDVDLPGGDRTLFAPAERSYTDISLLPDGRLFAVSSLSSLYELDQDSGAETFVARLGAQMVALDVTPDGELVAAGRRRVLRIDPDRGVFRSLVDLPPGIAASGDIAFVSGRMLLTATDVPGAGPAYPDRLYEVPPDGTPPFEVGNIGFGCVWGLAPVDEMLFGFTCASELLEIDPDTGRGRLLRMLSGGSIFGAAAR